MHLIFKVSLDPPHGYVRSAQEKIESQPPSHLSWATEQMRTEAETWTWSLPLFGPPSTAQWVSTHLSLPHTYDWQDLKTQPAARFPFHCYGGWTLFSANSGSPLLAVRYPSPQKPHLRQPCWLGLTLSLLSSSSSSASAQTSLFWK